MTAARRRVLEEVLIPATIVAAPPATVTQRNCLELFGLSKKDFLKAAGVAFPVKRIGQLRVALFEHVDAWVEHGQRQPIPTAELQPAPLEPLEPIERWPNCEGVYFVAAAEFIKIGRADSIARRLRELQTGCPHDLSLVAWFSGGSKEERAYHRRFRAHRLRGEWFRREGELDAFLQEVT